MSHDAVRAFYQKLSESRVLADNYDKLTKRWLFGYSKEKIVAFAAALGFSFTASELAFVRLTNFRIRSGPMTGSELSIKYFSDFKPTLHPQRPESPRDFYEKHNRHAEGSEPKAALLINGHLIKDGVCQKCGCSETYLDALHPSCRYADAATR